jgi:hypothetical protein
MRVLRNINDSASDDEVFWFTDFSSLFQGYLFFKDILRLGFGGTFAFIYFIRAYFFKIRLYEWNNWWINPLRKNNIKSVENFMGSRKETLPHNHSDIFFYKFFFSCLCITNRTFYTSTIFTGLTLGVIEIESKKVRAIES